MSKTKETETMRKVDRNKLAKRKRLLKSAYDLFTTVGFKRTTILAIATKAGVAKGTFYLYFRDKEDIRDCLIVIATGQLLKASVNELHKQEDITDFTDKIIFIADHILDMLVHDLALLQFVAKSLSAGGLFAAGNDKGGHIRDYEDSGIDLRSVIDDLIKESGVKLRSPDLLIYTIIEMLNSTCYSVILEGRPTTLPEFKPYIFNAIRLLVDDAKIED